MFNRIYVCVFLVGFYYLVFGIILGEGSRVFFFNDGVSFVSRI